MTMTSAAAAWAAALAEWAIPKEILDQAPESPWIHPPALFGVPSVIPDSPSHRVAREALASGGTVLDVGCGGGIAAAALTPGVTHAIGVDHQEAMLELFTESIRMRDVPASTVLGDWPDVASQTPLADVVTCHHVVYNVSDIKPFLRELHNHANRRVVLELPTRHPLSNLSDAWMHFWQIARPTEPGPEMLMDVIRDIGYSPRVEYFVAEMRNEQNLDEAVRNTRIRLCLDANRDEEIRDFLVHRSLDASRELATIWWDVTPVELQAM